MLNRLLATVIATGFIANTAAADPTYMLGGTIAFGGNASPQFGVTAKILSSNQRDDAVVGLGVTYYPGSKSFGADIGVGYIGDNNAILVGYDFVQAAGIFSLGYANTEDDAPAAPAPALPPPPP
ncbi:hypothetical protein [Halocynthiibacter namhaensis]|uniref:hypothetical protein n=1 Tax=Halocynthiibacter namhaensis TaxID=1290553 RepID=UPI00057922FB|nr:hypothetical protein [Halocynthiibacter namhaensis]